MSYAAGKWQEIQRTDKQNGKEIGLLVVCALSGAERREGRLRA